MRAPTILSLIPMFFVACLARAAMQGEPSVLRPGETIEGQIEQGDPIVETETLSRNYIRAPTVGRTFRIVVTASGTYHIDLKSHFFDAYLVLRDDHQRVVAEDDDGLFGTHSRLACNLEAGLDYELTACALHGRRGAFVLSMRSGAPPDVSPEARLAEAIADSRESVAAVEAALGPDHPDLAASLVGLANRLRDHGGYAEAKPLYERAMAIQEATLGPGHPAVAETLNELASLLQYQGDYAGARPLFERSLAIFEKALGPEHPNVAASSSNLAVLLLYLGDPDGARPLAEQALAIWTKLLGPEHPNVATSLGSLAAVLQAQGDYAAARPLMERALAIQEMAFGPDDPEVAVGLHNLANLLDDMGDPAAARPLMERSLAIWSKTLGPDDPRVATSMNNLAALLRTQGDYAGALPLFEQALAIRQRVLGPNHPDVAISLSNLAGMLELRGDFDGARALYSRALAILEKAFGPDHRDVATALSNLADLLYDMGDLAAARPLLERSLAIREQALGPEHPEVAVSLNNLAGVLEAEGDFAGARRLAERSLAIWTKALGPDHPNVAASLDLLAGLLRDQHDYAGARPLLERSLAIRKKVLGPEHPDVATCLVNQAGLLLEQGDHAGARPLLEQSLAIREKALGPDDLDVAYSLHNLAAVLQAEGDEAGACTLVERALVIWKRVLGPAHPNVASSLNKLALLRLDLGDVPAACALVDEAARSRQSFVTRFLQTSTESEARALLATLSWQVGLTQSPVIASARPVRSCEDLLWWKGLALRAGQADRSHVMNALDEDGLATAERLRNVLALLSRTSPDEVGQPLSLGASELQALIDERGRLEHELLSKAEGVLPGVSAWTDVRAALPEGSALVDFFVHGVYEPTRRSEMGLAQAKESMGPQLTAWITRYDASEPVRIDLGPVKAIEAAAHGTLGLIEAPRGASNLPRAEASPELERLIWEPLRSHLEQIATVIVSPDGVLATIPFEILIGPDGRYLVEDRSFVYLTDPTDLVRLREPAAVGNMNLLAVGDVNFDVAGEPVHREAGGNLPPAALADSGTERETSFRGAMGKHWKPLSATAVEVQAVMAAHAAGLAEHSRLSLSGPAATEESLKALLPKSSFLHLATHGYFNPDGLPSLVDAAQREAERQRDDPLALEESSFVDVARRLEGYSPGLLSGLVCAGANSDLPEGRDNGYLTAEEVGWLDLSRADLVVLSACDTGLGRPQSGEGLSGLRRAFLLAGAKTVISSLWSVPDQPTTELMSLFYDNLWQRKLGKHAALRTAQLEMIRRNRERFGGDARPVTWGAFVLEGDWQ